jgi:hypothetical protein
MSKTYETHKAMIWFVIGCLLGLGLMTIYGLGYDYVCFSYIQENLTPALQAPGLLGPHL